jgi:hypothetical protein
MISRISLARRTWPVLVLLLLVAGCGGSSGSNSNNNSSHRTNFYVSTSGNDDKGNGSAGAPFLTIDRARLAVRQSKQRGKSTITVNIEPGTYPLTTPIMFDPLDSGSKEAKVVYQAAPGSSSPLIISGGIPVTGFSCSSSNLCTASVPDLPEGIMPRQFYVNDQRAIRARSNYGQLVNLNYIRVADGYTQIFPEHLTHPELIEAVTVNQWKMMRCPVASLSGRR